MIAASVKEVRSLILSRLHTFILDSGLHPDDLEDNIDLLTSGIIDSIGLVELLASLEGDLGITIDYSELDPESLTIVGRLSQFITDQLAAAVPGKKNYKSA
jgi:acyl carrier protein